MSRVRVKICGIRTMADAGAAVDLGADALGFNFWKGSPRYVEPDVAATIVRTLSPFVACIGVFVNEESSRISQMVSELGLSAAQLHGDETAEYCANLSGIKLIKAFRVRPGFDPAVIGRFPISAALLDAGAPGLYGGTGQSFDWQLALASMGYASIVLAGGLNSDNVAEAIRLVGPGAVDVCSGVESEPGRKDLKKMKAFMAAVATANRRPGALESQRDRGQSQAVLGGSAIESGK